MLKRLFLLAFCLALPIAVYAGEPTKLREIDAKDLKIAFEKGKWSAPKTITSADELDKAFPGADSIKKKVDFAKEKLLVFAWGGSGGDKLSGSLSDDGKTATFTYKGGLTRDFRPHVHLFAVPKAAEVMFAK